jgi:hypothetical protein
MLHEMLAHNFLLLTLTPANLVSVWEIHLMETICRHSGTGRVEGLLLI